MNHESPSTNQVPAMTAIETWIKALTSPNAAAYQQIVNDPGASMTKGLVWLAGFGFVGGLFNGIVQAIFGVSAMRQFQRAFEQYGDMDIPMPAGGAGGGFLSIVGSAFGGLFGAVIGGLIVVGLVQLVSKMLKGTGTFEKLFYGYAAYAAPLSLVTSLVGAIPFVNFCLGPILGIYGLVLAVVANKATHGYDTGKAVIAVLAPMLLVFLFCCCIIVIFGGAFASLLGPSMEGVFEGIQSSLTP